ncbi:tudor domain-containing protein 1-like [Palaemon carinicauda]|uniref:tudor domain-containing protein 1-like n=1 Tax=Palaemon carinicauda TaxID=392227 RepID=UPI0035B63485
MGSLKSPQDGGEDELGGWDPRKEDYLDRQSSTSFGTNFSRTNNLARTKEVVRETRGLYVRNIPVSLSEESLFKIFSAHGKVLNVFIGKPRLDFAASNQTWGIVKVESMKDALAMITALNLKSPLKLKVELSLTEEERAKRRQEKEMEKSAQKEMETLVSNRICTEDLEKMMPASNSQEHPPISECGIGRGKMLSAIAKENARSVGNNDQIFSMDENKCKEDSRFQHPVSSTTVEPLKEKPREKVAVEVNVGCVSVGWRQPRPCVAEGCSSIGKLRCSVCKAFYCSKVCQIDDWFGHSKSCRKPPPLEDFEGVSDETNEMHKALPRSTLSKDPVMGANSKTERASGGKSANYESHTLGNKVPEPVSPRLSENKEKYDVAKSELSISRNPETHFLNCESRDVFSDRLVGCKTTDLSDAKNMAVDHGRNRFTGVNQDNLRRPFDKFNDKSVASRLQEQKQEPLNDQAVSRNASNKVEGFDSKTSVSKSPESSKRDLSTTKRLEGNAVSTAGLPTASLPCSKSGVDLNAKAVPRRTGTLSAGNAGKEGTKTVGSMSKLMEMDCIVDDIELNSNLVGLVTVKESYKNFTFLVMAESASYLLGEAPSILEKSSSAPNFEAAVGSLIAAKSPTDGSWYRAYVYGKKREVYSVIYIDFGNFEHVKEIKSLPPGKLSTLPGLAVIASYHGEVSNDGEKLMDAAVVLDEQVTLKVTGKKPRALRATLLESTNSSLLGNYIIRPWYVALPQVKGANANSVCDNNSTQKSEKVVDDGNISSADHSLSDNSISKFITISPHYAPETSPAKSDALKGHMVNHIKQESISSGQNHGTKFWCRDLRKNNLEPNKEYKVIPVWVGEDNTLFVHCLGIIEEEIEEMSSIISNHCKKAETPSSLEVGELVCGYCEIDSAWYRSEVREIKKDKITVQFVDFGNSDTVDAKDIRVFRPELLKAPLAAVRVKLAKVEGGNKEVKNYLMTLVQDAKTYKMQSVKGDASQFELFDNGVLLNDYMYNLVKSKKENPSERSDRTEKAPLPTKDGKSELPGESEGPRKKVPLYEDCKMSPLKGGKDVEVIVIHTSGPHAIYVIAKSAVTLYEDLEKISVLMTQYCESHVGAYYEPRQGEMCLAKFSEDGLWYRAACIKPGLVSSHVVFVDYGNLEEVPMKDLRQITDVFLELPCIAHHAVLKGVSEDDVQEGAKKCIAELLPQYTPLKADVEFTSDGVYVIDIPSVSETLIAEGLAKSK